ncbi:hypothetical protein AK812_SmicGene20551 [Symbiodinium microadriaticum]|uniref:Uncharacterized protein n=1 Tax=Symbiodinium microadriaticum TaxID=2951 RepID=A0A1Q9DPQ9_SYMMI|nr:hypothetical protein AK812_SmicGene20551 [Symbiodinium microadriaticum]
MEQRVASVTKNKADRAALWQSYEVDLKAVYAFQKDGVCLEPVALVRGVQTAQLQKDLDIYVLSASDVPTRLGLQQSLHKTQTGRALGVDNIPGELLHLAAGTASRALYQLFLKMSTQTAELARLKEAALFAVWKGKSDAAGRPVRLPYATPTEMSSDVTEEIAWEGEDHPFLMARAVLAGDLLRFALCLWLQGIPATAVEVGYPGKLFSLAEHPEKDGNTRIAQIYLDATGDADGVETVDGNLVLKCYQEQTFTEESGDPDYELRIVEIQNTKHIGHK